MSKMSTTGKELILRIYEKDCKSVGKGNNTNNKEQRIKTINLHKKRPNKLTGIYIYW